MSSSAVLKIRHPPTELGRLRILSSAAGLRVSPLVFGGGSIGQAWSSFWGQMDKETSFKLLDAFVEAGGNWIDTSNEYQDEESETWIGEWMKARGNRDQLVISTKFTSNYRFHAEGGARTTNHGGNHRRSLHMSVRDSLAKLQTDYIDILYAHYWDYTTSYEELMDSLHFLVEQGKVLYLGASDTPAWVVSAANVYARSRGRTPFSVYQGRWSVMARDLERDIIPMARSFGMALAPWGVLGGGRFQTRAAREERAARARASDGDGDGEPGAAVREWRTVYGPPTELDVTMSEALERVGAEHGVTSVTRVALAYILHKAADCGLHNVFPIVGGRKVEHLLDNIEALGMRLTDAQVERLESVRPFDIGFPTDFIGPDPNCTGHSKLLARQGAVLKFPTARKQPSWEAR